MVIHFSRETTRGIKYFLEITVLMKYSTDANGRLRTGTDAALLTVKVRKSPLKSVKFISMFCVKSSKIERRFYNPGVFAADRIGCDSIWLVEFYPSLGLLIQIFLNRN